MKVYAQWAWVCIAMHYLYTTCDLQGLLWPWGVKLPRKGSG